MLDADCDPVAVDDAFAGDPLIGPLVRRRPGAAGPRPRRRRRDRGPRRARPADQRRRRPDGRRPAHAAPTAGHSPSPTDGLTHLFPTPRRSRPWTPTTCRCRGPAAGRWSRSAPRSPTATIALDRGADRGEVRRALLALPGIGPWTADYVALRALGDPDVFLPTDIGVRDALTGLGQDPARAADLAEGWRPWRSYALMHLWQTPDAPPKEN